MLFIQICTKYIQLSVLLPSMCEINLLASHLMNACSTLLLLMILLLFYTVVCLIWNMSNHTFNHIFSVYLHENKMFHLKWHTNHHVTQALANITNSSKGSVTSCMESPTMHSLWNSGNGVFVFAISGLICQGDRLALVRGSTYIRCHDYATESERAREGERERERASKRVRERARERER